MARIRSIKPEACMSENFASVSVLAELTGILLPCFCDDEGRMKYSPALIKAQLFPLRNDVTIDGCAHAIEELVACDYLTVYEDDEYQYLFINKFGKHQHPQKPKPSELPEPSECFLVDLNEKKALPPAETIPVQYEYSNSTVQVKPAILAKNEDFVQEEYSTSTVPIQNTYNNAAPPAETIPVQYEYNTSTVRNSRVVVEESSSNNIDVSKDTLSGKPDGVNFQAKDVIEYLNLRSGKNFSCKSQKALKHIRARFKEGHTLEAFRKVIDVKCDEWLGTDFEKFIRPETLFGNKFDGYLQQPAFRKSRAVSYRDYD